MKVKVRLNRKGRAGVAWSGKAQLPQPSTLLHYQGTSRCFSMYRQTLEHLLSDLRGDLLCSFFEYSIPCRALSRYTQRVVNVLYFWDAHPSNTNNHSTI